MEAKQVTQWRTRRKKVDKVFFTLFFLCMHNSKEFIFNILLRFCCELWTLKLPSCFGWFCCGSHLIIWCDCEPRFTFLPDYLYMYFRFWRAHFFRSSRPEVFLEISQNSQENTCVRVSFLIKLQAETYNFIKKETLAQVFSCKSCEISKNAFSYRTPPVAVSLFCILGLGLRETFGSLLVLYLSTLQ